MSDSTKCGTCAQGRWCMNHGTKGMELKIEELQATINRLIHDREMDEQFYCPNTDVCAWCGDSECGGNCFFNLNPDDVQDQDEMEMLHAVIRRGKLMMQLERALAFSENRKYP